MSFSLFMCKKLPCESHDERVSRHGQSRTPPQHAAFESPSTAPTTQQSNIVEK
jgi:hypothetical protein